MLFQHSKSAIFLLLELYICKHFCSLICPANPVISLTPVLWCGRLWLFRGQLMADSRVITVSFPVDGESQRWDKGNTEEKLACQDFALGRPSAAAPGRTKPRLSAKARADCAKTKHMLIPISVSSHALFYTNWHLSSRGVPADSNCQWWKVKGFLSPQFEMKPFLKLIFSRIVSFLVSIRTWINILQLLFV